MMGQLPPEDSRCCFEGEASSAWRPLRLATVLWVDLEEAGVCTTLHRHRPSPDTLAVPPLLSPPHQRLTGVGVEQHHDQLTPTTTNSNTHPILICSTIILDLPHSRPFLLGVFVRDMD